MSGKSELIIPSAELPRELLDNEAFRLIDEFRKTFRATPEFLKALGEHYFGELDDGQLIKPDNQRSISFWYKGVPWEVEDRYTEDGQRLSVTVTSPVNFPFQTILISLVAKRKIDQKNQIEPKVQAIGINESLQPVIYRNSQQAVDVILRILNFYKM